MPREQATILSNLQSNAEEISKAAEAQARSAMAMPQEFLGLVEEARRDWLKLAERESQLMSELTVNLSACKSVPEIAKVYQDWMSERLVMFNQESQRMFVNAQRFMTSAVTMIGNAGRHQ